MKLTMFILILPTTSFICKSEFNNHQIEMVEILDFNGKSIKKFDSFPSGGISVNDIQPGLYLLKISKENTIGFAKLIIE